MSKPGWLALFLLALVKDELRLYQLGDGVELAYLQVLVFLMVEAQWKLHDWIVVLVVLLVAQSRCYCTSLPA
jgi:hypothetical protein